jgi:hypothetical protein
MNVHNGVTSTWTSLGRRNWFAIVFLLASATLSSAAATVPTRTARDCGVDEAQPPLKSFANFNGEDGWHEYKGAKEIPTLELGTGAAAFYWPGQDGNFLVTLQEPGEDFHAYTHFCFNRTGQLTAIHFELRTAWGWGFREEGQIKQGKLVAKTSEYFETKNDQPIKRPDMADAIPEALTPTLYLVKSKLPFAKLLPK